MKNTTYSEKLKGPKWQKKRLELLNLKGFKCEACGNEEKQIQVHHRFYINGRDPWEYDNDVFQVLCDDCHEKEHKKKDAKTVTVEIVPEYLKELSDVLNRVGITDVDALTWAIDNYCKTEIDFNVLQGALNYAVFKDEAEVWFRHIGGRIELSNTKAKVEELERKLSFIAAKSGIDSDKDYMSSFPF